MSALALALATLGNLLSGYVPVARPMCGILSAALVLLLSLRFALDSANVRTELKNPAQLSVLPAYFMALMVLATYLKPIAPTVAWLIWVSALMLQAVLTLAFAGRFLLSFEIAKVLPSWFIVFVGYVVASVTSPAFEAQSVGRTLLYAGLVGYAVTLAVVVYRMRAVGALPDPALPTVAIFAAPPSLCLVGYLAVVEVKQAPVVYALLALSVCSLIYLALRLPRILGLAFQPSLAALTFPVVISAVAMKQSAAFFQAAATGVAIPEAIVLLMSVAAAGVVAYVLARYVVYLLAPASTG